MKTALQLLTGAPGDLAKKAAQPLDPEWKTEVVDLTRKDVDYQDVLQKVFSADSIQVW